MKIKCPKCNKTMAKRIGNHQYVESGLYNVYFENIEMYMCSCGISIPSIYQVGKLNDIIAEKLVMKPSLLEGNEIRFLRKNIPISATTFAIAMGIDKSTLSKWENGHQSHRESNDRYIRTLYMVMKNYASDKIAYVLRFLLKLNLGKQSFNITYRVEKIEKDYVISQSLSLEGQINNHNLLQICFNKCEYSATYPSWATTGISQLTIGVASYSMMRLPIESDNEYEIFGQEQKWQKENQNITIH